MTCGFSGKKGPHWKKSQPYIQNSLHNPALKWNVQNAYPVISTLGQFAVFLKNTYASLFPLLALGQIGTYVFSILHDI